MTSPSTTGVRLVHWDLTERVIGAFRTVYNTLGTGFLEQVYVRALEIECRKRDLIVRREAAVTVWYDGWVVGRYRIDLLVNDAVIVEAKTGLPSSAHYAQVLNYLRCSNISVGMLLYFSAKPDFRRVTFSRTG